MLIAACTNSNEGANCSFHPETDPVLNCVRLASDPFDSYTLTSKVSHAQIGHLDAKARILEQCLDGGLIRFPTSSIDLLGSHADCSGLLISLPTTGPQVNRPNKLIFVPFSRNRCDVKTEGRNVPLTLKGQCGLQTLSELIQVF